MMKVLEHEILKTLKRASLKVSSLGSDAEGRVLINRDLIGYCSLHYGTLVALLNDPQLKPANNEMLFKWVVKKEQLREPLKIGLDKIESAVQVLILNNHITDTAEGKWLDVEGREIKMTPSGYGALNSEFYIREKEKEQAVKTANNLSRASLMIALAAVIVSAVPLFKSNVTSVPQLETIRTEMQQLRQGLNSKTTTPAKQNLLPAKDDSTKRK